ALLAGRLSRERRGGRTRPRGERPRGPPDAESLRAAQRRPAGASRVHTATPVRRALLESRRAATRARALGRARAPDRRRLLLVESAEYGLVAAAAALSRGRARVRLAASHQHTHPAARQRCRQRVRPRDARMHILGLNAYHGDVSAVLVRDGQLVAAVEEERFR